MATTPTQAQTGTQAAPPQPAPFPAFQTSTFAGQLIWLAISFGLLYYLMSKIALPRLAAVLDTRRDRIAADLDEAARARAESDAAMTAYEETLATAQARAGALAKETGERLASEAAAERRRLEAELGAKLESAERMIAGRKAEAMTNVRSIAADATSAIVERLTGRAPDPAAIEAALSEAAIR